MGRDKSTLPHPDGGTFVSHALNRLHGLCDRVCVCGNSNTVQDAEVINDPVSFQGPVVGIAAALAHANQHAYDACLVTPVDMPLLTHDDLLRLRDRWLQEPTQLCCAVSADDQRLQPLVAIYPVSLEQELSELAVSADRSLSRWFGTQVYRTIALAAKSCWNVNTEAELSDLNQ